MKKILHIASLLLLIVGYTKAQNPTDSTVILTGLERGSYYTIGMDIKKLADLQASRLERELVKLKESLDAIEDESDTAKIKKIQRKIASAEGKLKKVKVLAVAVHTSVGSNENFELLVKRTNVDIAFMQYDVIMAKQLEDVGKNSYYTEDLRVLMPLGYEQIHIVVSQKSKIFKFEDLAGKRVAVGVARSGSAITASVLAKWANIEWISIPLKLDDGFAALTNGTVDAVFFVGAVPVEKFERLPEIARQTVRLISPISPLFDKPKTIGKNTKPVTFPYQKMKISSKKYKWVEGEIETYAVRSMLVTNVNQSRPQHKANLALFELIKDNLKYLQEKGHEIWKEVDFNYDGIDLNKEEGVDEILELDKEEKK